VQVLRVTECEDRPIGDLDESYEAAVGENSTLAMLMEAISVDQGRANHHNRLGRPGWTDGHEGHIYPRRHARAGGIWGPLAGTVITPGPRRLGGKRS
jgi:hypothetical protein